MSLKEKLFAWLNPDGLQVKVVRPGKMEDFREHVIQLDDETIRCMALWASMQKSAGMVQPAVYMLLADAQVFEEYIRTGQYGDTSAPP